MRDSGYSSSLSKANESEIRDRKECAEWYASRDSCYNSFFFFSEKTPAVAKLASDLTNEN